MAFRLKEKYTERLQKKFAVLKKEYEDTSKRLEQRLKEIENNVNSLQNSFNFQKQYNETKKIIDKFSDKLFDINNIFEDSDEDENCDASIATSTNFSLSDKERIIPSFQSLNIKSTDQTYSTQQDNYDSQTFPKTKVPENTASSNVSDASYSCDKASSVLVKEENVSHMTMTSPYSTVLPSELSNVLNCANSPTIVTQNVTTVHDTPSFKTSPKHIVTELESESFRDIPNIDIQVGSSITACITSFHNLFDFWMEIWGKESVYSKSLYMNSEPYLELDKSNIKLNHYCLAPLDEFDSDFTPYQRAKIQNVYTSGKKTMVLVFFIDLGISKEFESSCLRKMPASFYSLPARAIHCSIAGIFPIGNTWSKEANENVQMFLRGSDPRVLIVSKHDEIFEVDFQKVLPEGEILKLSDHLCFLNFAQFKMVNKDSALPASSSLHAHGNKHNDYLADKMPICSNKTQTSPKSIHPDFDWNLQIKSEEPYYIEGNKLLIMPCSIYSPHEFYANIASENSELLDSLQEQMTNFYKQKGNRPELKPTLDDIKIGGFCCYEEPSTGSWYRACIIEITNQHEEEPVAKLRCVDFGDTYCVPISQLRPLTKVFAKCSPFAHLFSLAYIQPKPNGNNESLSWETDAIKKFKQLLNIRNEKTYTAEKIGSKILFDGRNTIDVTLWDTTDIEINTLLVNEGFAVYTSDLVEKNNFENDYLPSNWNPMEEEFRTINNSYKRSDSDIGLTVDGYRKKDDAYICKFYSAKGVCWRTNCPYKHIFVGNDDVTRAREKVIAPNNCYVFPKVYTSVIGQVSNIISPSHFYLTFPYGTDPYNQIYNQEYSGNNNSEYEEVNDSMNKYYNSTPYNEDTSVAPSIGTLVAAKSKSMNTWLRAKVEDVIDVIKPVEVFYVDVGNKEWLERENVRTLKNRYSHMPFQAIECFLKDIEPKNGGKWSNDAKTFFKELVAGKNLSVYVLAKFESTLFVELILMESDGSVSVGDVLITAGYAVNRAPAKTEQLKNGLDNSNCVIVQPG